MNPQYTFGADPELFVIHEPTGKYISAHELLPGTKDEPFPVEFGAVQVDGVAAEFNIDPSSDFKTFRRNIKAVRAQMEKIIQKNGGKTLKLVATPTAKFDKKYFEGLPDKVKELGCTPDYCGKRRGVNPRPDAGDRPFRTGGGHIHIGWAADVKDPMEASHFNDCCLLSKMLYGSGLNYDSMWDSDTKRRELYGSTYSFRPKSFGMEYRYLSNAWVDNELAMEFVWKVCENTMKSMDYKVGRSREHQSFAVRVPEELQGATPYAYAYAEYFDRNMQ